jgi:hypothetical protein
VGFADEIVDAKMEPTARVIAKSPADIFEKLLKPVKRV